MNEILFLRFFTALATTNADDPDIHAANDYAISLVKSNRAALTRAEAAEAERNTTGRRAFNAEAENQRLAAENRRLAARAAELEAQLAVQQWRPVTEKPPEPPDGEISEYLTWNDFTGFTVRRYRDGQFHSAFRKQPTHYCPLPPAPQETTQ